jgi:hypothetical protein
MMCRILFLALIVAVATAFNAGRMGKFFATYNKIEYLTPFCNQLELGVMRATRFTLEMAKKSVGDLTDAELKGKR